LLQPPRQSFFLFGPRGSGKSTWIRQRFPKALRFDLLDEALYQELLVRPAGFADRIRHLPPRSWVCVDEVQRLPSLLNDVHSYVNVEIQAAALVRSLAGFARFLPNAALLHGQVVNVSSLARDAGVARTTVNDYLEILEDTLLAFRVPGFEARLRVRERKHPKLYWVGEGLVRAATDQLGPLAVEERGPLFEGLVANCLRAWNDYRGLYDELNYWAPTEARGLEVDLL